MIAAAVERILATVPAEALVLDVGAWGKPFTRADWVLDAMPYETRGLYGQDGELPERFNADRWLQLDICDRAPWPFADGQFDFAVCSHTLEDVRDPVWVCSELARVARAGYIEVPSRLEEQSPGVEGPWVGWSHHRWVIDIEDDQLTFVLKFHSMHGVPDQHFPDGYVWQLPPEARVQSLWWERTIACRERIVADIPDRDAYFREAVIAGLAAYPPPPPPPGRIRSTVRRARRRLPPRGGRRP